MVLHQRPKSKRQTTRHRAKVAKKAREHERKLRKGHGNGGANSRRNRKDPGVPSSFPKKEAFLEQLSADRQIELEHKKRQRSESERLQEMLLDAQKRRQVYEGLGKENPSESKVLSAMPNRKTYYREFKQVIDSADVILEVLDSRDPLGSRVEQVEKEVREAGKKLVLVLSKTDLVPTGVVRGWLSYLRRYFPTVAFRSSINSQSNSLGHSGGSTANDALGADQLIALLKNYCRSFNLKTAIAVGVVGYPNVGKSSLINSLKRSKVCRVGAAPGITTVSQRVHLDKNISLLDCPGIVLSSASSSSSSSSNDSIFLRNVLKVEQLEDPISPVATIMHKVPREQLVIAFGCNWDASESAEADQVSSFLRSVALAHGRLKKGGIPDLESAARYVLKEWNNGKIRHWSEPPQAQAPDTNSGIMSELSPEFVFDDTWLNESMQVDDA